MASRSACTALGYPPVDIFSLALADLVDGVDEDTRDRLLARIADAPVRLRGRLRRKDGSSFATAIVAEILLGADEELLVLRLIPEAAVPQEVRGTALDAALLRSVIDTAPDAIVTIDDTGRMLASSVTSPIG